MKKAVIGILAHVDAGKTTLSEEILYRTGAIRTKGSVDHGDTVMDTDDLEMARGITIYSAEAEIKTNAMQLKLIDTPGHVDFSSETERAIAVLDAAVLVVSGPEGVESHTRTLWDLLKKHHIPTFLFVNKMDIAHRTIPEILKELQTELSEHIVDFTEFRPSAEPDAEQGISANYESAVDARQIAAANLTADLAEEIAVQDEETLERYTETEQLSAFDVERLIAFRRVHPVIFGSARAGEHVDTLLSVLEHFLPTPTYPEEFGALCYKVDRDAKGNRLTFLKVTGGTLKARMEIGDYKINEIRSYTGNRYDSVQEVAAGEICAVTGLDDSKSGKGYGMQSDVTSHDLEPVFRFRVLPGGEVSSHTLLLALRELEEEDPLLDVSWEQTTDEIHISLMGEIQKEILTATLQNRFNIPVTFAESRVTYKETIVEPVEGHGHFEPLRHFADVWIRIEPLPQGSGISAVSECSTDELDENYQRQVLRRLLSGRHRGILVNAELTDVRFVLTHGRSHTKHTEGGDFRKATDLAVRDALMHGIGRVLEPYYHVRLQVPLDRMGRAMTDLTNMHGQVQSPEMHENHVVLEGVVPVSELGDYQASVNSYTGGLGNLSIEPGGYLDCHNEEEVIDLTGYDYRRDAGTPYISVYVHQDVAPPDPELDGRHRLSYRYGYDVSGENTVRDDAPIRDAEGRMLSSWTDPEDGKKGFQGYGGLTDDLQKIFERTYGKIERKDLGQSLVIEAEKAPEKTKEEAKQEYLAQHPKEAERRAKAEQARAKKRYVLVDCYNVIFSWPELSDLARTNVDSARGRLLDILCNYQGYLGVELIAVFDAYKVKGNPGSAMDYHNIHVIYTKEKQTADAYIERATHEIMHAGDADVTVITSDGLEQMIVIGEGAHRMSSREFIGEVDRVNREGQEMFGA